MKNAQIALVNLLTLLVGIAIGVVIAPHVERPVKAADAEGQAPVTSQTILPPGNLVGKSVATETARGTTLGGTAGTYLLLAHHIQSDELVVNGIDLLRLEQGELNLLARTPGVSSGDVQRILTDAIETRVYQFESTKSSGAPIEPGTK
jgi:hypothetical protein